MSVYCRLLDDDGNRKEGTYRVDLLQDVVDGSGNRLGGDRGRGRESRGGTRAATAAAAVTGGGQRRDPGLQVGNNGGNLAGNSVCVGLSLAQNESDLCLLLHWLLAPSPGAYRCETVLL